ncbi:hypothetical protein LEP1GSC021_3611, partial [Leptospira noguchii str. 1993005606]
KRIRCRGLARAELQIFLSNFVYNTRRFIFLSGAESCLILFRDAKNNSKNRLFNIFLMFLTSIASGSKRLILS